MWLTWFSTVRSDRVSRCPIAALLSPFGDQGGDLELAAGESGLGPAGRGQLGRKLGAERMHA